MSFALRIQEMAAPLILSPKDKRSSPRNRLQMRRWRRFAACFEDERTFFRAVGATSRPADLVTHPFATMSGL